MKETIKKVEQWFKDRQIIENSTPIKQVLKTSEEVLELQNAILNNDLEEIKDAIGDIQVTLVGICLHMGIDLPIIRTTDRFMSIKSMLDRSIDLSDEINKLKRLILTDDTDGIRSRLHIILTHLNTISYKRNLTLEECLGSAYGVISKRTGKMINGQFVKDK